MSPAALVDTHCHLGPGDDGDGDPAADLVARARTAGVVAMVDVGVDAASSAAAAARAAEFDGVAWSAGLHPCAATALDAEWPAIEALARRTDCAAIGETGFDLHWHPEQLPAQERAFERHCALAAATGKPLIVHARKALAETFAALARHRPGVEVVLHCFSGDVDDARRALDLGCTLSFAGPLTYPRADALRAAARYAPLDRILVETDSPWLPPQSRRGRRNEPAFVAEVVAGLASARGSDFEAVAAATTANARRVFG